MSGFEEKACIEVVTPSQGSAISIFTNYPRPQYLVSTNCMPNFFFDVLDMKSLSFDTETAMDTAEWHAENPSLSPVPEVSFSQCHDMSTMQRN